MNLNDFYLVKCFGQKKYRDDFNCGTLYLNSTAYYWSLENTFQQDQEGMIFSQSGEGYLIQGDSSFERIIKCANSLPEIIEKMGDHGVILAKTSDCSIRINGFICCFYLLPKQEVIVEKDFVRFKSKETYNDFLHFTSKYLEGGSNLYGSIFVAARLCMTVKKELEARGYQVAFGDVEYNDLDYTERIACFNSGAIDKIIFTKPKRYQYQKEFRIFVSSKAKSPSSHILEEGLTVNKSLLATFDYHAHSS